MEDMFGGDDPASFDSLKSDALKLDALSEAITGGILDEILTGTPNGPGKETADENDDRLMELEPLETRTETPILPKSSFS